MLCRKFKNILITNSTNSNVIYQPLVQTRSFSKWFDTLSGTNMASTIRLKVFRDLFLARVLNSWTKSYMFNSVLKRCRTDRGMNKMFLYFRQVFFRPRTQLLVSATATFKNTEEKPGPPKRCSRNIKDKEMKRLIKDLDRVEDLSKATLYCEGCDKRIVIDSKHTGVQYCECPHSKPTVGNYDGWEPYMEAEDVIIWRKEYKPGGLYAYKVYGRYKHLTAEDFALIQVDGAYRKVWDSAVASISVVEREANGLKDQTVLHWEVLWPTLFTNRDYVYLRRHMAFNVQSRCLKHKDGIFPDIERCVPDPNAERACTHAKAKEASQELDRKEEEQKQPTQLNENKVYVIISRSCSHPAVPETRSAIRVMEYWSHMVVTTLNGPEHPGMEFVLTYYDEPAVGGLPPAVMSWAMGRAGPAFLERMRGAAQEYAAWRSLHNKDIPDFTPFEVAQVSYDWLEQGDVTNESDMESSKEDPELDEVNQPSADPEPSDPEASKVDGSTQTRPVIVTPVDDDPLDGPRLEAEASLPLKYASKEYSIPNEENKQVYTTTPREEREEDMDSMKCQLTLSTTSPQTVTEDQLIKMNDNNGGQHLNIFIQLPMSEILQLTDKADQTRQIDHVSNKITTTITEERDGEKDSELERDGDSTHQNKKSFWRYLYPLYYFV